MKNAYDRNQFSRGEGMIYEIDFIVVQEHSLRILYLTVWMQEDVEKCTTDG